MANDHEHIHLFIHHMNKLWVEGLIVFSIEQVFNPNVFNEIDFFLTPEPVRALNTKTFDFQVSLKIIFLILWEWGDNTKTKFRAYINAILTIS